MSKFCVRTSPIGDVEIACDEETARLIADALDIINPDEGQHEVWARDCAFSLQTYLDCQHVTKS